MSGTFLKIVLLAELIYLGACTKPNSAPLPQSPAPNTQSKSDDSWKAEFPSHWWKSIPREEGKSWEILPQDAGYKEVVLSKRNELGLLSNFSETPFVYRGVCYPTVEAYWQMKKFPEGSEDPRWAWAKNWKYTREQVSQMSGYAAKSAGSYANFLMEKNDANWITFEGKLLPFVTQDPGEHYRLTWEALIEKVRQNQKVLDVLLATKDLKLLPDHGVSERSPREWHYYLLWMDIRSLIQSGVLPLETAEDMRLRTCKALNKR